MLFLYSKTVTNINDAMVRSTKMRVKILEKDDWEINIDCIFQTISKTYPDVHFVGLYLFEESKYLYIQAMSQMTIGTAVNILRKFHNKIEFTKPESFLRLEGDLIEAIGNLRKRGCGRRGQGKKPKTGGDVNITNNNVTNNNTTNNNININIQIVRPNGVGEESLSHVTAEDLDQIMRALDSKKFPTILDVEIYLRVLAKFADVLIRDIKNCNVKGRQNDALYKYVSPGGVWLHERKSFGFVHRVHDNWVNHLKTCFEEHKGDMSPEYLESFERCNEMLMELRKRGDERYERVAIMEGTAIMGNMAERVKFGEKHENLKLDGY